MDLFEKKNWIGTLLLAFVGGLCLFIVCALLGMFIDPAMPTNVRGGVVGCWGIAMFFYLFGLAIIRHGDN